MNPLYSSIQQGWVGRFRSLASFLSLGYCLIAGGLGTLSAESEAKSVPTSEHGFPIHQAPAPARVDTIAFGSCAHQNRAQEIWGPIIAQSPDLFLFLGDNVYADTDDLSKFREAYRRLGEKPGYRKLVETTPVLAVWDDHDYGLNDGGADFVGKDIAEQVYHEFFSTPEGAAVRSRPGIYDVKVFGEEGERLQVIMLDTRYFRSPLVKLSEWSKNGRYQANPDPEATLLGDAQWQWLAEVLQQPADLRVILSSIQFLPQDHAWERWENFPRERKRLLDWLKRAQTGPVLFLSGDRHMGEMMALSEQDPLSPGFPVYEVTSSGLTNAGGGRKGEPNRHRTSESNFQSRNFGLVQIDWEKRMLQLELRDVGGGVVDEQRVSFGE